MSKKVIRTYLWISGLFTLSASMIWGINTLFLLSAGLSIFEVFLVNGVFTFSMALFEIPTGVVADTLGRRISFLMSSFVLFLGTIGYVLAIRSEDNLMHFIWMSVVLGIAFTFYSGAVEAWLVDALNFSGYDKDLEHVFSLGAGVSGLAMLVGTLSGGFLGTLNLSIPYIVRATIIIITFLVALFYMKDLGYEKKPLTKQNVLPTMKNIWMKSVEYGVKQPSLRKLMTVNFLFSTFMMWGWYAWQPYFLKLYGDTNAVWVAGIISAIISLSMATASFAVPKIMVYFKMRSSYLKLMYLLQAILVFVVGLAQSFYLAVGAYIMFAFIMGLTGPVKQSYFHSLTPSSERATVVSFDSLVGSLGGVVGQPSLGYMSNNLGIGISYRVSSLLILSTLPVIHSLGKIKDEADIIGKS